MRPSPAVIQEAHDEDEQSDDVQQRGSELANPPAEIRLNTRFTALASGDFELSIAPDRSKLEPELDSESPPSFVNGGSNQGVRIEHQGGR